MSKATKTHVDRDLIAVDVGCRWGFAEQFMDCLDSFKLYGFDPDEQECVRLSEKYSNDRVELVPLALSDKEEVKTLYSTLEPACSSIFEPIEEITESYPGLGCAKKVSEANIQVTTLSKWAFDNGVQYIDYLKVDTQGAELSILKGAGALLDSVRVLEVEVEFNPIYKGQPLFSDVDAFLRDKGFVLWKLSHLVHYGMEGEGFLDLGDDHIHNDANSQKIKKYGGQLYWADAHYVKKNMIDTTVVSKQQSIRDITLLKCLGFDDIISRLNDKNRR